MPAAIATITISSNAGQVGRFFIDRSQSLRVRGAKASLDLAEAVRAVVTPVLIAETPVKTGALARSLQVATDRGAGGIRLLWWTSLPYARYVLDGTGIYHVPDAHSEWDVNKFQAFQVNGQMVFTRHTHHLGQHPNDYPDRAMKAAMPRIEAAIKLLGDQLMVVFS